MEETEKQKTGTAFEIVLRKAEYFSHDYLYLFRCDNDIFIVNYINIVVVIFLSQFFRPI